MAQLTITEALAELKTIEKRLDKKRAYIGSYLMRQDALKDPLEKDGGAAKVIQQERQAMADLTKRHVGIRLAIQRVNHETPVTVEGITKSLAEWLTWRKEVAPQEQQFLMTIRQRIDTARAQATRNGAAVVASGTETTKPQDIIVNIDEAYLAKEQEHLETVLGTLDGQLSLKNATVTIDI